jgi:hypothetical protein
MLGATLLLMPRANRAAKRTDHVQKIDCRYLNISCARFRGPLLSYSFLAGVRKLFIFIADEQKPQLDVRPRGTESGTGSEARGIAITTK